MGLGCRFLQLEYILNRNDKSEHITRLNNVFGLSLVGMSGDTELFEKPSNIKDLWASEQKNILYIPLF